jgi:hypothetical protein
MRHAALLFLLCFALTGQAGEGSPPAWPMRDRVYLDAEARFAVRLPYTLIPQDQYAGDLWDSSTGTGNALRIRTGAGAKAELEKLAGGTVAWADWTYRNAAADPKRPHADPDWAPEGVSGSIAAGKDLTLLALAWEGGGAGLAISNRLPEAVRQQIIASAEVLIDPAVAAKKAKSRGKAPAKPITWRHAQSLAGKVLDAAGRPVAGDAKLKQSVPWPQAWEAESEHYHITSCVSPARLSFMLAYHEALFRSYVGVFEPDRLPPYKAEVHIFDTHADFLKASAAWGHPLPSGPGQIVGGFFAPGQLSLWLYEESGKLGGRDFTIEHVAAHECTHQFVHLACNGSDNVPTWINEGLAVYFENGEFRDGKFIEKLPVERLSQLRGDYGRMKKTYLPLTQYLDHHGHIAAAQYGEVFLMTHYWIFGATDRAGKPVGRKLFGEFWRALRNKEDGNAAFERVFMSEMVKAQGSREKAVEVWTAALLEYVKKVK